MVGEIKISIQPIRKYQFQTAIVDNYYTYLSVQNKETVIKTTFINIQKWGNNY